MAHSTESNARAHDGKYVASFHGSQHFVFGSPARALANSSVRPHIGRVRDAPRSIVLIGFMGSGKSSVGRLLGRQLDRPRFDTDKMVEEALGMSISKIFALLGEARFRDAETAVLRKLDGSIGAIVITGGGIVLRLENIRRLRELGTVVWLTADLETLRARLSGRKNRPLVPAQNRAEALAQLLAQRKKFYEEAADLVVDTSRLDQRKVAQAICDGLQISH